jgi:hypothetical protein
VTYWRRKIPSILALTGSAECGIAIQPYRRVANPRKFFRQSMAAAFFSPPRIRREKALALPQENLCNLRCLQFAARLSYEVNVRRGSLLATRLKRLTFKRISHHTARHWRRASSPHAAQVLTPTMDFRRGDASRLAMRLKRFTSPAFSSRLRAARPRTAFGLLQRA